MLYTEYLSIKEIVLHKVGNKLNQDNIVFSNNLLVLNPKTEEILIKYFITPFKTNEYFHFFHESMLTFNEVYVYVSRIFENPECLYEQSVNLAKHLYEKSTHPKIKGGEFYVVYFKDCIIDGNTMDAVGLFKSENKDTFIKVHSSDKGFEIESENGTNINKLDKGCLIFNTEQENGYLVTIIDNTNKRNDAKYWTEDFLHVHPRKDSYNQTQNMLSLCKNFVSQLPENEGKVNKALLINKSVEALKNESINIATFSNEVFKQPELISQFNKYREAYQAERGIKINDNFKTSSQALKQKGLGAITTIKLDKNFDINIHGGEKFIERGYDEEKKLYYYKLYFEEEK